MSFGGNFVAVPICGVVKYNYIHAHDCHDGYMYVRSFYAFRSGGGLDVSFSKFMRRAFVLGVFVLGPDSRSKFDRKHLQWPVLAMVLFSTLFYISSWV